ncbi:hypothetical protein AQUCO_07200082v1 [Aquilegia coerulea]|uniref:DUF7148 domain-containing protein n=1 Tax=Aquilegia coerulea TaxID=218851 RepID=A0A2G5CA95_AQUCA|nr:hypothetical protein AQUCO_07200082v1 [Aquilegia coerulea]
MSKCTADCGPYKFVAEELRLALHTRKRKKCHSIQPIPSMACSSEAMVTAVRVSQLIQPSCGRTYLQLLTVPSIRRNSQKICENRWISSKLNGHQFTCSHKIWAVVPKASSSNESIVETDEEEGVQLGSMKLPPNIDIQRFESLLFQWANSLCQGATLPLPMPLKVDKITGGARLGFIEIGDAKTEVPVYIDCLVVPATETSSPIFLAIRNGPTKDRSPPGEPRIMRSLQEALKKSVQIASV